MTKSSPVLRVGTRNSKLALIQTKQAISYLSSLVPFCKFELSEFSSPGDRDQQMDLRTSPPDFFTKDLDDAILDNSINAAIHSAKDIPQVFRHGLDWCWLPLREDPRDALILPDGVSLQDISSQPRIGISSERREAWCLRRFPDAKLIPIRGTIEKRLEQLDNGDYDIIIMAGAALIRLGLQNRISQWIDANDLLIPDGQGVLALTFRYNDAFWTDLRKLFVKQVVFSGAGCGRKETCTLETISALNQAEVCIYDALIDKSILYYLPSSAIKIDAGKRLGNHHLEQSQINTLLIDYARRGFQVLRLKGGDPGIFGRLAEEITMLDNFKLPYKVYPGISSLQCATTGTGMLLTRRGVSRGFCVMTPRSEGGSITDVNKTERAALPQVYFMGLSSANDICTQLIADGTPGDARAAVVYNSGSFSEVVIKGTISTLPELIEESNCGLPGIIIVGEVTRDSYSSHGALGSKRILVTCSEALQNTAILSINRYNGIPIPYPAIKLTSCPDGLKDLKNSESFDWLVVTSPSAVHAMISSLSINDIDIRSLPPIVVSGDGTAKALENYHMKAAIIPENNFSAEGLTGAVSNVFKQGQRVLRLRSDSAGETLSNELKKTGVTVIDRIICLNEPVHYGPVPQFDAILFCKFVSSIISARQRRPCFT